jgi:hypothetical protein
MLGKDIIFDISLDKGISFLKNVYPLGKGIFAIKCSHQIRIWVFKFIFLGTWVGSSWVKAHYNGQKM